MLRIAFKEWSAVCRAIAAGRQSVILRKGGIAEVGGEFRPEHHRFWLYPTHFHEQQRTGLKPSALADIDADRPPVGTIRLSHFVEVADVRFLDSLDAALALDDTHVWTADTVRQRFHYRTPGLYALSIRAFVVESSLVPERPEYAGCKTWVELIDDPPDVSRAVAVSPA